MWHRRHSPGPRATAGGLSLWMCFVCLVPCDPFSSLPLAETTSAPSSSSSATGGVPGVVTMAYGSCCGCCGCTWQVFILASNVMPGASFCCWLEVGGSCCSARIAMVSDQPRLLVVRLGLPWPVDPAITSGHGPVDSCSFAWPVPGSAELLRCDPGRGSRFGVAACALSFLRPRCGCVCVYPCARLPWSR